MRVKGWSKAVSRWATRPASEMDAAALALVSDAKAAARLRAYQNDANVAALTIERTRDRLDRWGWLFLFAGLAYTTVNVQAFVAGTADPGSLRWWTAWLVEPMVMGLMLVLLRGEQIANRYQETSGRWVKVTRWAALLITYVMNTGTSWVQGNPGEVFMHSVPVVLVFLAAEALVQQRLTLTEVVDKLGRPTSGVTASSRRRTPDSESLGVDRGPNSAQEAANNGPEGANALPGAEDGRDDLRARKTLKERAYEGFCALVADGRSLDDIRPSEVDRAGGVPAGTAKVTGRMAEFRARWATEQDRDEEVSDGEAAG